MFSIVENDYIADGTRFSLEIFSTSVDEPSSEKKYKKDLEKSRKRLSDLQKTLYADNTYSVLLIFQAMDAAGKDSTIKHVLRGVNPAGCQVFSFKRPSKEELDHDFLWRSAKSLPERGRIGVFNRSYYEEVLTVKVHPEFLSHQHLPKQHFNQEFWQARYESIADHEKHLVRNGTVVLKFFLNVSREEQHRRFLSRLENADKNWKFSAQDLDESELWGKYMAAYETAIQKTSTRHAPWFCIPADNKPAMRAIVAKTICEQLASLPISYPSLSEKQTAELAQYKKRLIV